MFSLCLINNNLSRLYSLYKTEKLTITKPIIKNAQNIVAINILLNIEVDQNSENKVPYTDMGAMVLKYVIEKTLFVLLK